MKYLLCLLVLGSACFAQPIPTTVTTVSVHTRMPDSDLYPKLVEALKQQGWTRDYEDSRPRELVTRYKPTSSTQSLRLITSVGRGVIRLRGESSIQEGGSVRQPVPVVNNGTGGDLNQTHFEQMNKLALRLKETLPGSWVVYSSATE